MYAMIVWRKKTINKKININEKSRDNFEYRMKQNEYKTRVPRKNKQINKQINKIHIY